MQIERRVNKTEIREHSLSRNTHSKLEEIVIRFALVIIYALLYLKDVNRENRCFTVSETALGREHNVSRHHSALGRGIRAVIYRGERVLRTRTRIHRVKVMNKRLHCLIGRSVCFRLGELLSLILKLRELVSELRSEYLPLLRLVIVIIL